MVRAVLLEGNEVTEVDLGPIPPGRGLAMVDSRPEPLVWLHLPLSSPPDLRGVVLPVLPFYPLPVGARLADFAQNWAKVTPNPWVLGVVAEGWRLKFASFPPLTRHPHNICLPRDSIKAECLLKEVDAMLEKRAIEIVLVSSLAGGFFSHMFTVPKKTGGLRPVIDLKALNSHLAVPKFKLELIHSIHSQLNVGGM